jgi:hypothetical protein
VFALFSKLNIGQRHLLPTFPVMFILAGAAGWWLRPAASRVPRLVVALLLLSFVGESLATWPNYLAYFNVLAGGPVNGYRHLVDSSLDWGQDLSGLKKWLDEQGLNDQDQVPVYLSYFGTASPKYYGIRAISLPSFFDLRNKRNFDPLKGGVYCISATMLQTIHLGACRGEWNDRYEQRYLRTLDFLERLRATGGKPEAKQAVLHQFGDPTDEKIVSDWIIPFHQLRLGRLCAHLRRREPDHQVGHSILIYRLTDEEVQRAVSPFVPPAPPRRS